MSKPSLSFQVRGLVRGVIGNHRALPAAVRTMMRDHRACRGGGSYSDARVYVSLAGGPEYQVPVAVDTDGTWTIGEWSGRVPQNVRAAVG